LSDTVIITHHLPGRIRFSVRGLKRNQSLSKELASFFLQMKGVVDYRISPVSGRVLVFYNSNDLNPGALTGALCLFLFTSETTSACREQLTEAVACSEREIYEPIPLNQKPGWPQMSPEEALQIMGVTPGWGLGNEEALARLEYFGPNKLKEVEKRGFWSRLLDQFRDFLVQALMGSTAICLIMGEFIDACAILSILVINAVIGASQEQRAAGAVEALKELSAPGARILREGRPVQIPASRLVPGDILLLEQGDIVPADARLLNVTGLSVEESAMTGEPFPVAKQAGAIGSCVQLFDCDNMVFQGATVVKGRARALVTATGMETEIGKIAGLLQEGNEDRQTPLQEKLSATGRIVFKSSLLLSGAVVALGILRGGRVFNVFLTGVSLAVAAIPEGLPAVVTIALATGAHRMAKTNAVVKSLPAVESVGATTIICSDKTGTLTTNQQTVRMVYVGGQWWALTGTGYNPDGGEVVSLARDGGQGGAGLVFALAAASLCSNASLKKKPDDASDDPGPDARWQFTGDPTEVAILAAAVKAGLDLEEVNQRYTRLNEIPFDADRRRMSVICSGAGGNVLFVKGAPDTILDMCRGAWHDGVVAPLSETERRSIIRANDKLASRAMRVLAVAYRPLSDNSAGEADELERDLVFIGLLGILDPPRLEVKESIARCKHAGIKVAMITGDHPNTAVAVGKELGILKPGENDVLTGRQLEQMKDEELLAALDKTRIFARVPPRHKLRLVRAFRERGELVTMIGDGVNDAPAVKEADIGIAMGGAGMDVTKKSALIIIIDDNFSTVLNAVEQGRGIYANIRKSIRYLLATNTGEVLLMFGAIALGLPLPLLPIQLLWLNLLGDGLPALALAVDPLQPGLMNKKPRAGDNEVLDRELKVKVLSRGLTIGASTLGAYILGLRRGNLPGARTLALATLTSGQLLHALDCRAEGKERSARNPFLLKSVLLSGALLAGAIYLPIGRSIFRTTPLGPADWGVALGGTAVSSLLDRLLLKTRKNKENL